MHDRKAGLPYALEVYFFLLRLNAINALDRINTFVTDGIAIMNYFVTASLCLFLFLAMDARQERRIFRKMPRIKTVETLKKGPATLFIHGTIVPVLSRFTHGVEYPHGFVALSDCTAPNRLTRLAHTVHISSPKEFPLDSFYFYCWPGDLRFSERRKATEKLAKTLCMHEGPKTLIAHSHGCNVALYLAELAKSGEFKDLVIDRLILLACPVQLATAHLVGSPIFKRVFSFYSTADLGQIIDPQGLYNETKKISKDSKKPPLFSQRLFDDSPNLVQARILMNRQSPGHMSFLTPRFLSRMPAILALLEEAVSKKGEHHCIVNIPPAPEAPHLIEKFEMAHSYVPRTTRSRRVSNDTPYTRSFTA